jgi:hypothetical protein
MIQVTTVCTVHCVYRYRAAATAAVLMVDFKKLEAKLMKLTLYSL